MFSLFRRPTSSPISDWDDHTQFEKTVQRERLRSDRAGLRFAILKLQAPEGVALTKSSALMEVASEIPSRVRQTDSFGRFEDGLAVLLLDADQDGAEIVANDLCHGPERRKLRRTIYLYPKTNNSDSDQDASHRRELVGAAAGDARRRSHEAGGEASIDAAVQVLAQRTPWWKRAMDIVGSSAGLLLLSPLLAITAVLVKLTSPGPAIFQQRRAGLGGRPFTMYKFRTMRSDAEKLKASLQHANEQDGPAFKIKNDPRITPLGRILRKTCIDELPQLWNVLRGDMSLVGPRPLPVGEADAVDAWSQRRLDVTPGLTCIWQVSGGVDVTFNEWMRMDLAYIRSRSLLGDVGLILKTVRAVLLARASH